MQSIDPVTYEVLRHRLWSINEEHGLTIARISGSPIVTLSHDFNPCIHLPDGEVVFSGPYIQCLNGGASDAIAWILDTYTPEFVRPGDMFLTNDPWIAVIHQLDVCILAPIFVGNDLLGWVSNAVHQYDLGGSLPGSFTPQALSIFEEALPIPPIRIVENGEIRPDLERMFLRRSRLPDLLALDLRAGVGGCNVATEAIFETFNEYGVDVVQAVMRRIVEDAEAAFLERLDEIPTGRWCQEYYAEARDPESGLVGLKLGLEKTDDQLIFDNRGDPEQHVSQSMTAVGFKSAVLAAVAAALCHDQLFAIGGAVRRVRFDLTSGTVGSANMPTPISCANMRVVELAAIASHVIAKMLSCSPTLAAQAVGAGGSAGMPVMLISGHDAQGQPYGTAMSDHMFGAIAPSPLRDGVDSGGHSWDPRSLVPNVEDQELVFPILYLYRHELPDSGGAGCRRGANGGSFAYVPLDVPSITVATVTSAAGTRMPPSPGVFGGNPSGTTGYRILRHAGVHPGDGQRLPRNAEDLEDCWDGISARSTGVSQYAGDVVEERWCGSGGFGDPLERDPASVANDVRQAKISLDRARKVHGVAVAGDQVRIAETEKLRKTLRADRLATSQEPQATAAPVDGRQVASVGPYLRILRDEQRDVWACTCGAALVDADTDFRNGCRSRETHLADSRLVHYGSSMSEDSIVTHEFFCPQCLRLLSAEVGLAGAKPARDFELTIPS
jgi:N-methylhydantoinase B